jgi:hypothetical protein
LTITKKRAKCLIQKELKPLFQDELQKKNKLYLGNPREELLGLLLFLSASEGGGDRLVVDLTED